MLYVAMLRLLAIGLLGGVVMPLMWLRRGEDFEQARLSALILLEVGQFIAVPVGLVAGLVLAALGLWSRPPGFVLGAVTSVFGVIVAALAWATMGWIDGDPPGIGDPDGESLVALLAFASGVVTIVVGLAIALVRWSGYDPRAAPVRRRVRGRARRSRVEGVTGSAGGDRLWAGSEAVGRFGVSQSDG
ncbi:hypothetical protein GCM10010176_024060 [Nonomuraea spiralis]|nr:hypothetical protein GCM10010176_024060 [Nonomuraea spiralis]